MAGTADDGDSVTFTFDSSNWFKPKTAYFTSYQTGTALVVVANGAVYVGSAEDGRLNVYHLP